MRIEVAGEPLDGKAAESANVVYVATLITTRSKELRDTLTSTSAHPAASAAAGRGSEERHREHDRDE